MAHRDPSPLVLICIVCGAEVLTMVGVFAFPALLPLFFDEWGLTNTEAGWIAGIRYAGYAAAVLPLVSFTDRIDARRVHMTGALIAALSLGAFALTAQGFWGALIYEFFAGIGLSATYMPGLRALVDRYTGDRQPRAVAFYTASFSLGTALSFLIMGEMGAAFGWRAAFGLAACLAFLAVLVMAFALRPVTPDRPAQDTHLLDFRPVVRNHRAMGYVLGYFIHSWELFAYRGWLVAFLVFGLSVQSVRDVLLSPTTVATISGLVAVVASVGGNEIAEKKGRRQTIIVYMFLAAAVALGIGFLGDGTYWIAVIAVLVYAALIQLDSAALTAGVVAVAEDGRRGATLGLHSLIGFTGAAIGPIAVGAVLDLTGSGLTAQSWGLAFASVGVVGLFGPLFLYLTRPRPTS